MIDAAAFIDAEPAFHRLTRVDQTLAICWYLHFHAKKDAFSPEDIRACFRKGHVEPPDLSVYLPRLEKKRPPQILRAKGGYRLEGSVRRRLDAKYGKTPSAKAVSSLLASLPAQIPDLAERDFLREALDCYKIGAYRAATVMTWNLAFDHFCNWLVGDASHLGRFNKALSIKFPKRHAIVLRADLEDLKESEIIELARIAKLIPKNIVTILEEKLKRRNMAAHPSSVAIEQPQADDAITDLIKNVVLKFA